MYKTCKTEESAIRQRGLEALLLREMSRQRYAKISISGLCAQAGIPRKTFYRYFPTKDDALLGLIDHKLEGCNEAVFAGWNGSRRFEPVNLERFFGYWRREEAFLDAVRDNDLRLLLLDRTTKIVDTMKRNSTEETSPDFAVEQVEYFIAHGLMSTVLRWHHYGFPCAPEEMAGVFTELLSSANISISRLFL